MYYYDIFVRHAFHSYGNILREVAFGIKMGQQLTFVGSKSVRTDFDKSGRVYFFPSSAHSPFRVSFIITSFSSSELFAIDDDAIAAVVVTKAWTCPMTS
mmetsp:Transcript_12321/g.18256  ORF Transcript_12321/g.18256 Transcript_12321/m.18256 type:complete len:99 (+) Transcript_12321:1626-1922(+)